MTLQTDGHSIFNDITNMAINSLSIRTEFVSDIRNIIEEARHAVVRSVDDHRVVMYWKIGERTHCGHN